MRLVFLQRQRRGACNIKATRLADAWFLVDLPSVASLGGAPFDPVFSDRCSPNQFPRPKMYTNPPRKVPELDGVVILVSNSFLDLNVVHDVLSVNLTTSMGRSLQLRLLLDTLLKRTRPPDISPLLGNKDSDRDTLRSRTYSTGGRPTRGDTQKS